MLVLPKIPPFFRNFAVRDWFVAQFFYEVKHPSFLHGLLHLRIMWRVAVMPVCIIDSHRFITMRWLSSKCRLPNVNSSAAVENGSICVSCHSGFRLEMQGLIILNFALACFGFPCRFIALRQSYFQLPIAAFCGNVLPLSCENIAFWGENIRRFHAIISPLSCG